MKSSLYALTISGLMVLAACSSGASSPGAGPADDQAATSGATSKLKSDLKAAFEATDQPSQLPAIASKELPPAAKSKFDEWNKTWGPDYAPYAVKLTVDKTDVIVIGDENDGGAMFEFYTMDGKHITGASAGESDPLTWDK